MKQRIIPTLAFTLFLTISLLSGYQNTAAASASETTALTMEQAVRANTAANLLKHYQSVTYAQLDYIGGNTMHLTYFKDKQGNPSTTEDDFGYTGYRTDSFAFSRENGKSTYELCAMKNKGVSEYLFMVQGSEFTSQTTDKNGNLVCVTQADINQDYADQLSTIWKATTKDKMVTTTVFAADDFRVLSIEFSLRRPDGAELPIASGVMLYDQKIQHSDAVQGYLNAKKVNVSICMEDGTTRMAEIPKGKTYTWNCDEGYALYLDKDGKTPLSRKPGPVQSNLKLYCLPVK